MLSLDFSYADLNLPETREKTRRASISGVQDKMQRYLALFQYRVRVIRM